jgi:transposase
VYGALRVGDGQEVTMTAPSRNSIGGQQLLAAVETANPAGTIMVITDNLSSHSSVSTRAWLADHPRIQHTFIPKGACWLNLQEGWWRLFRREAFAGQSFATPEEITLATKVATCQLNPPQPPRGCGAAHHRSHAIDAAPSPTGSKERSIKGAIPPAPAGRAARACVTRAR